MKTDYNIVWLVPAEAKLLTQAEWIKKQSCSDVIALKFYKSAKKDVEKLSYFADAYKEQNNKKIPILNGNYIARFIMDDQNVYIIDFKSAKQNH